MTNLFEFCLFEGSSMCPKHYANTYLKFKKKKSIAKTDWAVGLLFYKCVLSKRISNLKYLWVLFSKLQADLSK